MDNHDNDKNQQVEIETLSWRVINKYNGIVSNFDDDDRGDIYEEEEEDTDDETYLVRHATCKFYKIYKKMRRVEEIVDRADECAKRYRGPVVPRPPPKRSRLQSQSQSLEQSATSTLTGSSLKKQRQLHFPKKIKGKNVVGKKKRSQKSLRVMKELTDEDIKKFKFIWVVDNESDFDEAIDQLEEIPLEEVMDSSIATEEIRDWIAKTDDPDLLIQTKDLFVVNPSGKSRRNPFIIFLLN